MCLERQWRRLPRVRRSWMFLNPHLPLRRLFEFPNRGVLLELVNTPLAGFNRFCAVFRPDDDQDDILPDLDRSISMQDEHFDDVELLEGSLSNLPQLLLRHPLVVLKGNTADRMAF